MLRKDFLQRQIEEFGKVLALILGFKKEQDWEKFEAASQAAMQQYSGEDLGALEACSLAEFTEKIRCEQKLTSEQKKIMATLLFERLLVYEELQEHQKHKNLKEKCIFLYQHLAENLTTNEYDLEVHYKLKLLKADS